MHLTGRPTVIPGEKSIDRCEPREVSTLTLIKKNHKRFFYFFLKGSCHAAEAGLKSWVDGILPSKHYHSLYLVKQTQTSQGIHTFLESWSIDGWRISHMSKHAFQVIVELHEVLISAKLIPCPCHSFTKYEKVSQIIKSKAVDTYCLLKRN